MAKSIMKRAVTGKSLRCGCVNGRSLSRNGRSLLLLLVWLLAGCGGAAGVVVEVTAVPPTAVAAQPATPTPTPIRVTEPASVTPTTIATHTAVPPSPIPSPTPPPAPEVTHYALWAILDNAQRRLTVTQTITYVNKTTATHTTLPLLIEPARSPDVFHLQTLAAADQSPLAYTQTDAQLTITLPAPLPPDGYVTLHLTYTLNIPAQPGDFGYTPRQTNFGNWYPMVPPYSAARGWISNEPANVGEHLVYDRADYDVYLRITPTDPMPVLAANGFVDGRDGWQHYQLRSARNFAWSVGHYVVATAVHDGVQVTGYAFPEDEAIGRVALDTTVQALILFSDLFAPYPHDALTLVVADFRDGMEFDGLYFLDQGLYQRYNGTPREYLIPIAAHETAHQWWQGIVGSDQAQEPWLDEALATYSELLFYEQHYPELVEWWWHFRVNRFEPTGWVDSTIYAFDRFRPYVNTIYLRGALLLHDMRGQVGDDAFFAFLRAYTQAGLHTEQLTGADFWQIWSETTQTDSQELRQRYFLAP